MNKLIVLDCEGVLIDYNKNFNSIYKEIYGKELVVKNTERFHLHNYYELNWISENEKKVFFEKFNSFAWDKVEPLLGAVEATNILKNKGFKIICLTSVPEKFQEKIQKSLHNSGLLIDATIATGRINSNKSKNKYIEILQPNIFIDDLKSSFYGLKGNTKNILIDNDFDDSPNSLYAQTVKIQETYPDLISFSLKSKLI